MTETKKHHKDPALCSEIPAPDNTSNVVGHESATTPRGAMTDAPIMVNLLAFGIKEPQSLQSLVHRAARAKTRAKRYPKRATTGLSDDETIALLALADFILEDVEGPEPPAIENADAPKPPPAKPDLAAAAVSASSPHT